MSGVGGRKAPLLVPWSAPAGCPGASSGRPPACCADRVDDQSNRLGRPREEEGKRKQQQQQQQQQHCCVRERKTICLTPQNETRIRKNATYTTCRRNRYQFARVAFGWRSPKPNTSSLDVLSVEISSAFVGIVRHVVSAFLSVVVEFACYKQHVVPHLLCFEQEFSTEIIRGPCQGNAQISTQPRLPPTCSAFLVRTAATFASTCVL